MDKNELVKKLRQQKGVHSYYEMKSKPIAIIIRICLLVIPAFITFLSISDIENLKILFPSIELKYLMLLISIISLILFVISVLTEIFGIDEKYKEHRNAINQLIKLRKNLQNEIDEHPDKENDIVRKYNDIYSELVNTFPQFTDRQYMKGKKYYIERLEQKNVLEKRQKEIESCK